MLVARKAQKSEGEAKTQKAPLAFVRIRPSEVLMNVRPLVEYKGSATVRGYAFEFFCTLGFTQYDLSQARRTIRNTEGDKTTNGMERPDAGYLAVSD